MPPVMQRQQSVEQAETVARLLESYLNAPTAELAKVLRDRFAIGSEEPHGLPLSATQNALEQSPVAVSITDLNANILYINRNFTELTGYQADDILGQNESVLSYKSTPESVYRDLWQTLQRQETWCGTLINRRKDGTRYLAEVQITPLVDEQGGTSHYLGLHRDITELFALERKVSNQKALIESVVDATPAAIAVLDHKQRVVLDNQAYKQLAGDMPEEEPARSILDKLCQQTTDVCDRIRTRQSFHDIEVMCDMGRRRNDRWLSCSGIWFSEKIASVDAFFSDELAHYMLLIAHDITSQKQQQERIRSNAMRALLAEEGLRQGMQETLAAAVFQLESPLNMLSAALEMHARRAEGNGLDASLNEVLHAVRDQGLRAIDNLRRAAPAAKGTDSVPLNLNQLVHDVLLVSTEELLAQGIVIDWRPRSRIKPVCGDEIQLRSMVKHLLDNAIEAIIADDDGRREITLITDDDEQWVRLRIGDSGGGIPEALRIKVFEPFFTTKGNSPGHHAGMGLTLAQEVVNQHAGTIEVAPGHFPGCCIELRLPAFNTKVTR